jgi:glycine/D-amino acid oxidase-like deaminating enzyme
VTLSDGSRLTADSFVFACGPWLISSDVIGDRGATRQEVFFSARRPVTSASPKRRCPSGPITARRSCTGFPATSGEASRWPTIRAGPVFDLTIGERTPTPAALETARTYLGYRFPALKDAPLLEARVCQYEASPDEHFIIDRHPEAATAWLVGGGSGHGSSTARRSGSSWRVWS